MDSKQSPALIRQQFWTIYGQYMRPIPSASGEKINWVNYKTGIKFIRFIMQSNHGKVCIGIELSHPETSIRDQQFKLLQNLKTTFEVMCGAGWHWKENIESEGKRISIISTSINGMHILNRDDWPTIISFFKAKIIALDQFWNEYQWALQ